MTAILSSLHAAVDAAFDHSLSAAVDTAMAERTAELAARSLELDRRESDLATAAELLAIDSRVTAALSQGQELERRRILTLIDLQIEHLHEKSSTRIVLRTLKKTITEA
jgi:hypothetical protein